MSYIRVPGIEAVGLSLSARDIPRPATKGIDTRAWHWRFHDSPHFLHTPPVLKLGPSSLPKCFAGSRGIAPVPQPRAGKSTMFKCIGDFGPSAPSIRTIRAEYGIGWRRSGKQMKTDVNSGGQKGALVCLVKRLMFVIGQGSMQ
jgi:hypothetical protein